MPETPRDPRAQQEGRRGRREETRNSAGPSVPRNEGTGEHVQCRCPAHDPRIPIGAAATAGWFAALSLMAFGCA